MINQAQLAEKLKSHFESVSEVRPGVLRATERFGNREYAVRYFDLTGNITDAAMHLREYQEDLMADSFFGSDSPVDLRWNHYLYFVTSDEEASTSAFNELKVRIETDRTYARKVVLNEKEFNALVTVNDTMPATPPVDIASQWVSRLDALSLSYILDDAVSVPEAVRLIKSGRKHAASQITALASLSVAEIAASSKFLKSLTITGFRDYPSKKYFEFGKVNLITGLNGSGKTSLLEAIEYLYCRENRRHDKIMPGTKIVGEYVDSNASLTTTSSTQLAALRARNSHWYAKADVRKPTLKDSFGKFNFLDTDAAVDLSNNNDSDERLRSDVARLLLGAEAEKLATKLSRVSEQINEAVRGTEQSKTYLQSRISEARIRLIAIRKAPQSSDALYNDFQSVLSKSGWKNMPASKENASILRDSLQSSVVAIRQLSRVSSIDSGTDFKTLTEQNTGLKIALKKAEELSERIKTLMFERTTSNQLSTALEIRKSSIDIIMRYASLGFTEKSTEMARLLVRVDGIGIRLAALGNAQDELIEMRESDILIKQALKSADDEVRNWDMVIRESTASVRAFEASMESVNVLKQRLLSSATELMVKLADPDHCPVCRTQFDAGELELRMSILTEDSNNESLEEARAKLSKAKDEFAHAKLILSALRALVTFVDPKVDVSVRQAQLIVDDARALLEQYQRDIKEIEREMAKLTQGGLTEHDLRKRLAELTLDSMPNASELNIIQNDINSAIADSTIAMEELEQKLTASRLALTNIVGIPADSLDASPNAQVQHLRSRLTDIGLLVSATQTLESVLDVQKIDSASHELQLEQALEQLTRLVTALSKEAHAVSTAKAEESNITKHKSQLIEYEQQLDRLRSARTLINELLKQAKTGVFTDQVMKANASAIGEIFAAIHAPNEFVVQVANNSSLKIIRESSKLAISLQQMSTGQRAAYALSLFLSMNRSLVSGPPLVLLDDPIAHIDDLNILSFLDYLRDIAVRGNRQIFLATADDKLAGLFRQKFRFMGQERFCELVLSRNV